MADESDRRGRRAGGGLLGAAPASAQQRPLITEDPLTVGNGRLLFEVGLDYEQDVKYPLSGLSGDLFGVPNLGISIGISSIAELQIDGGVYQRLSITEQGPAPLTPLLDISGTKTSSIRDLLVGTKVQLLGERPGRPALGARFATRLPMASLESGLGRETTDLLPRSSSARPSNRSASWATLVS